MLGLVVASLSVVILTDIAVATKDCNSNLKNSYQLFGAVTPYETVRGDIRNADEPTNCQPVGLWSIHRHGNRYPFSQTITKMKHMNKLKEEIINASRLGKSLLCDEDINSLNKFSLMKIVEKSPSVLTNVGYEELKNIGARIREKFPQLLNTEDKNKFYFRPTNKQRTIISALAFTNGLSMQNGNNLNESEFIIDAPIKYDDILMPFKHCKLYREGMFDKVVLKELEEFYNSSDFKSVKNRLHAKLGISRKLLTAEVLGLYEICRFYRSWSPQLHSSWCSVFSKEDLIVLEYFNDVQHYYYNGYGFWGIGKNMVAYFAHDTTLEMFYSALGLFNDTYPITGATLLSNRKWKTSTMSPFAANFIAVFYRCNENNNGTIFRTKFFVNEKEVSLCSSKFCSFEEFQFNLQSFEHGNLDFCNEIG